MRGLLLFALMAPLVAGAQGSSRAIEASAGSTRDLGFAVMGGDPLGMSFEEGRGRVSITATDRGSEKSRAAIRAEISLNSGRYRITAEISDDGQGRIQGAPPGGVATNVAVHGGGFGLPRAVAARASFAVVAVGSVYRDDELLTDRAVIYGFAITDGTHADDSTHQVLPAARPGDTEIELLVANVPGAPGGFLRLFWDDVNVSVSGSAPPNVAVVPSAPGQRPEDAVATRNYGTTLLPQALPAKNLPTQNATAGTGGSGSAAGTGGSASAAGTGGSGSSGKVGTAGPLSVANSLDATGGQIVGTRSFADGQPVTVTGVDARSQTVGPSTTTSTTVDPFAQVPSFSSATDSTITGTTVRVANSNAATPLPGSIRPLNSSPTASFPPQSAALNSQTSTVFPGQVATTTGSITPGNSTGLTPTTGSELNPSAPAIGTSVSQFPGLNASSTNATQAQSTSIGLPQSTSSGVGAGSGTSGTGTLGIGGSGAFGTGGTATPTNTTISLQPFSSTGTASDGNGQSFSTTTSPTAANGTVDPTLNGFNTALPQPTFGGSTFNGFGSTSAAQAINSVVPNPAGGSTTLTTLPGAGLNPANIPGSAGGFAGLPVIGGSGTFPGLMPSSINAPVAPAPTSGTR